MCSRINPTRKSRVEYSKLNMVEKAYRGLVATPHPEVNSSWPLPAQSVCFNQQLVLKIVRYKMTISKITVKIQTKITVGLPPVARCANCSGKRRRCSLGCLDQVLVPSAPAGKVPKPAYKPGHVRNWGVTADKDKKNRHANTQRISRNMTVRNAEAIVAQRDEQEASVKVVGRRSGVTVVVHAAGGSPLRTKYTPCLRDGSVVHRSPGDSTEYTCHDRAQNGRGQAQSSARRARAKNG